MMVVVGVVLAVCGSGVQLAAASPVGPLACGPSSPPDCSYEIGFLSPVGADTTWAIVESNSIEDPVQAVERSGDGGRHWSDVTPPGYSVASGARSFIAPDFDSPEDAWLAVGSAYHGERWLLETSDGGRSWARAGRLPAYCGVQFVNRSDGWCISGNGALGSETVVVYRTLDGGRSWRLVSTDYPRPSPGAIPFSCDKSVSFAGPRLGYAASACNGGYGFIDATTDGGSRWHQVLLPRPAAASDEACGGSMFGSVVAEASSAAVGYTVERCGAAATSTEVFRTATSGRHWTEVTPPGPPSAYEVDIVTSSTWKLVAPERILTTSDAGRSWTSFRPRGLRSSYGAPPTVHFATSEVGWGLLFNSTNGSVLHTTDGGRTWQDVHVPL